MRSGFLFNRNGGDKPSIAVHIGFLHHRQKLPSISRQRLHITPLPLSIEGIKGQRRLPRPRKARNHNQLIPRQRQINIFQIMRTRTTNRNSIHIPNPKAEEHRRFYLFLLPLASCCSRQQLPLTRASHLPRTSPS